MDKEGVNPPICKYTKRAMTESGDCQSRRPVGDGRLTCRRTDGDGMELQKRGFKKTIKHAGEGTVNAECAEKKKKCSESAAAAVR